MPSSRNRNKSCQPEDPWCKTNAPDSLVAQHITAGTIRKLAACGVLCKGYLAEQRQARDYCGMTGAIADRLLIDQDMRGNHLTFEQAVTIGVNIIHGTVEPSKYFSPKSKLPGA